MLENEQEFLTCVKKAFELYDFKVEDEYGSKDGKLDFILSQNSTQQYAVEVKYYRSKHAKSSLIKTSIIRLIELAKKYDIPKAIFVTSSFIDGNLREELEQSYQITIVDRVDILIMSGKDPDLQDKIRSLLSDESSEFKSLISSISESLSGTIRSIDVVGNIKNSNSTIAETKASRTSDKGKELCTELKKIQPGLEDWVQYENKCIEILEYLFGSDLDGWHKQTNTTDGLNRYDLICRIKTGSVFWNFLINDLDSRYVLFEFKNHKKEIDQGQVYTTEKYLLKKALRGVAFILSRKGADKNAVTAMQGAMREHGKLMLPLDDKQICKMLKMKDSGSDPADYLFELADKFLISLPR
ncbi:MAG: restriction endonuclease [Kangiella sp.]|nr:restriction endonuclease [Kangiella sp.]